MEAYERFAAFAIAVAAIIMTIWVNHLLGERDAARAEVQQLRKLHPCAAADSLAR